MMFAHSARRPSPNKKGRRKAGPSLVDVQSRGLQPPMQVATFLGVQTSSPV
jgi:hypothetical protein